MNDLPEIRDHEAGDAVIAELEAALADLTALREADQATIASLALVNKELADALEEIWRRLPRWKIGNVQPGPRGRDSDIETIIAAAEAALRSAGRLQEPPQG